jgi:tetratricopeptide (TPR) repeat protein
MPKKPASNIIDLANRRRVRDRQGPGRTEQLALDRAQELIYRGWEVMDPIERVEIAEEALTISPLCADAWVMLAEDAAETLEQEIEFYLKAVEAGERALGEEFFETEIGAFWGIAETRPYMRARAGLAHCLWDQGEHDAAIAHYDELLLLNPADNQGIRFLLVTSLVLLGRHEAALKVMDANPEDEYSAVWAYSRALIGFRDDGDDDKTRSLRAFALRVNRFVPDYLSGASRMPKFPPDYVNPGDKTEAVSYVYDNRQAWQDATGSIDWLLKETRGN